VRTAPAINEVHNLEDNVFVPRPPALLEHVPETLQFCYHSLSLVSLGKQAANHLTEVRGRLLRAQRLLELVCQAHIYVSAALRLALRGSRLVHLVEHPLEGAQRRRGGGEAAVDAHLQDDLD
jgi:hypothetical protein